MRTSGQLNLERDIIQARLLSSIFSRSLKNQVALKGGVAMRVLMGSPRHTKDIDLAQNPSESLRSLQNLIRLSIKECASGFLSDLVVTEPKQTETVARWKIGGKTQSGTEIHLTVEVSRRGIPAGHVIQKALPANSVAFSQSVIVDVYDEGAMSASKVFALHSDNRVAPRDLYDLHILVQAHVKPDPSFFEGIDDKRGFVEQVWKKIDLMGWELFREEVIPFLPESAPSRIDEGAFLEMKLVVGEAVESWLVGDDAPGCSGASLGPAP